MTSWRELEGVAGPWLHSVTNQEAAGLRNTPSDWGGLVISIDGQQLRDVDSLLATYARVFKFPNYFGANWAAFNECMTTLESVPARGYVTLIENGDQVLLNDRDDYPTFVRQLSDIGGYWGRSFGLGAEWNGGEVPFHTVLIHDGPERYSKYAT